MVDFSGETCRTPHSKPRAPSWNHKDHGKKCDKPGKQYTVSQGGCPRALRLYEISKRETVILLWGCRLHKGNNEIDHGIFLLPFCKRKNHTGICKIANMKSLFRQRIGSLTQRNYEKNGGKICFPGNPCIGIKKVNVAQKHHLNAVKWFFIYSNTSKTQK